IRGSSTNSTQLQLSEDNGQLTTIGSVHEASFGPYASANLARSLQRPASSSTASERWSIRAISGSFGPTSAPIAAASASSPCPIVRCGTGSGNRPSYGGYAGHAAASA